MGGILDNMHKVPLLGSFFDDPAEEELKSELKKMGRQYEEMRPWTQESMMNALRQSSLMAQPYQDLMGMMYGQNATVPTEGLFDNPMSPEQMGVQEPGLGQAAWPSAADQGMASLGAAAGMSDMSGLANMAGIKK
jgi:hypothetical protein